MKPIPFFAALIPLYSRNSQSIALCSTIDDSIIAHGQPTQTPKKLLCYSDLSHQNLIDNMRRDGSSQSFLHAHNLFTQTYSRLTQPPILPTTCIPATILISPPPDDIHCQVCQSPFDEHKVLVSDICNTGLHMDCLLPPLTTTQLGPGNAPYESRATSYPKPSHDTFAFLPPFSILTLIKKRKHDSHHYYNFR